MRYAVLIYERPGAYAPFTADERSAVSAEYVALARDARVIDGLRLQPAELATTVRVTDGDLLVTDGPFADTKEVFGGLYIVEADDLDEVLELAARVPAVRLGGSVEIRPVMQLPN